MTVATKRPDRAIENLTHHQEQCDMDGVMVKVSRQALDEVLAHLRGNAQQPVDCDSLTGTADDQGLFAQSKFSPGNPVEVRLQEGEIDEIVIRRGDVHIEQMSADGWFMGIDASDGSYWQFWFGAKNGKSHVHFRHTETVSAVEQAYPLPSTPSEPAQAVPAPVAWRLTDGEGDYEYLTEEPSDQSRAWSRRYGRKWEPLYASPVSSSPSEAAKAAPDREQLIECISRFDVFSTAAQVADAILALSVSSTQLCCPAGCMFTPCRSSQHSSTNCEAGK